MSLVRVYKSRLSGVFAFVTMRVPVVSQSSVTLCLPFCGSCMGACILGVTLSLEVCAYNSVDGVIWGSIVMCVCGSGLFLLTSLGRTHLASVSSPDMTLVGMGVGAPSEGRFLALKPLSPAEARMRVPGHPDPPVSSLLTWCKASPWNVGVGWGVAAGWGGEEESARL